MLTLVNKAEEKVCFWFLEQPCAGQILGLEHSRLGNWKQSLEG